MLGKLKASKQQKAELFIYLGLDVDLKNLDWFLLNNAEIIHQGKGLSAALYELTKEYTTYALVRCENSALLSLELPLGIKASEYNLFLEDEVLGNLDENLISVFDKQKLPQGQLINFVLINKEFLQNWQEVFAKEQIYLQNFYLDVSFLKDSIADKLLIFSDLDNQDLYVYQNSNGALSWIGWDKNFAQNLPPILQDLLANENIQVEKFATSSHRINRLLTNKAKPVILKLAKVKQASSNNLLKKLSFVKNFKMPSFAFLKRGVFWFASLVLVLFASIFIMQNNLEQKKTLALQSAINNLKMQQNISTQELTNRIEVGAKNYPQVQARLNKINSIINRINSRLNDDIYLTQLTWDLEKMLVVLSVKNPDYVNLLKGLSNNMQIYDSQVKLEFNLN